VLRPSWTIELDDGAVLRTVEKLPLSYLKERGISTDRVRSISLGRVGDWLQVDLRDGSLSRGGLRFGHYAAGERIEPEGLRPLAKRRVYGTVGTGSGKTTDTRYLYFLGWESEREARYLVTDGKQAWIGVDLR